MSSTAVLVLLGVVSMIGLVGYIHYLRKKLWRDSMNKVTRELEEALDERAEKARKLVANYRNAKRRYDDSKSDTAGDEPSSDV